MLRYKFRMLFDRAAAFVSKCAITMKASSISLRAAPSSAILSSWSSSFPPPFDPGIYFKASAKKAGGPSYLVHSPALVEMSKQ